MSRLLYSLGFVRKQLFISNYCSSKYYLVPFIVFTLIFLYLFWIGPIQTQGKEADEAQKRYFVSPRKKNPPRPSLVLPSAMPVSSRQLHGSFACGFTSSPAKLQLVSLKPRKGLFIRPPHDPMWLFLLPLHVQSSACFLFLLFHAEP